MNIHDEDNIIDAHDIIDKNDTQPCYAESELMSALEDEELSLENIEQGLDEDEDIAEDEIDGYIKHGDASEIESEIEQYESAEDMEKMLAQAIQPNIVDQAKQSKRLSLFKSESRPTAIIGNPIGLTRKASAKTISAFLAE